MKDSAFKVSAFVFSHRDEFECLFLLKVEVGKLLRFSIGDTLLSFGCVKVVLGSCNTLL